MAAIRQLASNVFTIALLVTSLRQIAILEAEDGSDPVSSCRLPLIEILSTNISAIDNLIAINATFDGRSAVIDRLKYPQCVLRAVDLGCDTDTTAAVAGALAGLWYGSKQIPAVWELKTAKYEEIKERTKRFYAACTNTQCE